MAEKDDKGFFDRLGEILNSPLPGTKDRIYARAAGCARGR